MHKSVCVKGESCTQPPLAKQPEKFPGRYNMSSTLRFNIPAMITYIQKKRIIYTKERENKHSEDHTYFTYLTKLA